MAEMQETHRDRILNASTDCFLELGFERTSTAEIARRAKVSKREIYAHFADKRTILAEVIIRLQGDMQQRLGGVWSSSGELETVLLQAAKILHGFVRSELFGKMLRIVATEAYHDPEVARKFYESGLASGRLETAEYMRRQMRLGKLKKSDPFVAANDFLDLAIGSQLMTAVILGQIDREPVRRNHVKHVVEMFLRGHAPAA
jgi:AcrR family transcriptional regulator